MENVLRGLLVFCCLVLLGLTACSETPDDRAQAIYHLVEARNNYIDGDYHTAEIHYEKYLRNAPDGEFSWEAWNRRVYIWLTVNNDSTKAAEILEQMAEEYAQEPERVLLVLPQLANAHRNAGSLERAVESWERFIRVPNLDPYNATMAIHTVARLHQFRRDFVASLEALQRCFSMTEQGSQTDARLRQWRYRCQYEQARTTLLMQRVAEARPQLEALIQSPDIDPTLNATAAYVLAEIYRTEQHDAEKAMALLRAILPTYPNRAVIVNRIKKLEEATN